MFKSVIFLSVFLLSFSSLAKEAKNEGFFDRMADKLELTESQRAKLKEFRVTLEKERKELRAELKIARDRVEKLIDENAPKAELEKAHAKIKEVQAKISDLRFKNLLDMRDVLTPEQRAKMTDLRKKMKERWEKHFGGEE